MICKCGQEARWSPGNQVYFCPCGRWYQFHSYRWEDPMRERQASGDPLRHHPGPYPLIRWTGEEPK
jgi:hypothetical protein